MFNTRKRFRMHDDSDTDDTNDVMLPSPTAAPRAASDGVYDIGAIAEQAGSTRVPFVDDRLIDEDGNLRDLEPATTQVRENTVRLGNAAADAVLDRVTREEGRFHAAGEELIRQYDGAQTELIAATKGLVQVSNLEQWAEALRDNTRPAGSKMLSLAAKPLFLLGDTSVIGGMLYLTGAPTLTAAATGISAATGAVFAGSVAGHNAAAAYQRARRGPAPDGCPDALADLYDDPEGKDKPWSFWAKLGGTYAGVLGIGVMAIGIGAGIPPAEAMGNGMLTMLTVAGSAAAEAYSTNAAADRLAKYHLQRESFAASIRPISQLRAKAQALLTWAGTVRAAGSHEAAAAMNTTMVVSMPATYDPRTFGYLSPMPADSTRVELRASLPAVIEPPKLVPNDATAAVASADIVGELNKAFANGPGPVSVPLVTTAARRGSRGNDDTVVVLDDKPLAVPAPGMAISPPQLDDQVARSRNWNGR